MGEVILFGILTIVNLVCVILNSELKAPVKFAWANVAAVVVGLAMIVYKAM